jgi:hypothetical protein
MQFSRTRLSDHLLPVAFATPAWPSGIVSSEVPGSSLEFLASPAISFLPSFRNMMKALPLPSPKVLLLWNPIGTVGNSDSLTGRRELRFLISPRFCPAHYLQGPPVLPRMTAPACHPCYPGSPTDPFWQFSLKPVSQPSPPDHRVGNSSLGLTTRS